MFCACCAPDDDGAGIHAIHVDEGDGLQIKEELTTSEPAVHQSKVLAAQPMVGKKSSEVLDFSCLIERPDLGVPLGVMLDPSGYRGIHIRGISSGDTSVNEVNRASPTNHRLGSGDYIVDVNGVTGDHFRMLNELLTKSHLSLRVIRPYEFEVMIHRRGESLGCTITYDACSGCSLVVDAVLEGPIRAWNQENPNRQVRAGDRILSANGQPGSSTELLEVIKATQGQVKLIFSRPALDF